MGKQRFTKEDLNVRMDNFCIFVKQHDYQYHRRGEEKNKVYPILVYKGQDIAKVIFSLQGGIRLIAKESRLKDFLRKWFTDKELSCKDFTTDEKIGELAQLFQDLHLSEDSQSSMEFLSPATPHETPGVRLPDDNPLIALAERLHYAVYLVLHHDTAQILPPSRYYIQSLEDNSHHFGSNLLDMLAEVIQQRLK